MSPSDLVAEMLPPIAALLDEARDRLAELADLLSDEWADRCADVGAVGCKTPARALRVYGFADDVDGLLSRLERWSK